MYKNFVRDSNKVQDSITKLNLEHCFVDFSTVLEDTVYYKVVIPELTGEWQLPSKCI
jgi:hypothetical protein